MTEQEYISQDMTSALVNLLSSGLGIPFKCSAVYQLKGDLLSIFKNEGCPITAENDVSKKDGMGPYLIVENDLSRKHIFPVQNIPLMNTVRFSLYCKSAYQYQSLTGQGSRNV